MAARMEFTEEQQARMRDRNVGHKELAREFGCSDMPIRRWRDENGVQVMRTYTLPVREPGAAPSTEELLRDEIRQLRARGNRDVKAEIADERALLAIEAAAKRVGQRHPLLDAATRAHPMSSRTDDAHHVQLGVWSDWHYGEVVDREQMSGLAEFNVGIAEDRIAQLVHSTLAFKKVRPPISRLHIGMLGDMASGPIHGLEETNEVPAAEQYVRVGQLMGEAIEELAPHYPEIIVDCTFGNHPRAQEAPVSKGGHNSGDWIAYHMAAASTRHLPNVEWNIPRAGMVVREIAGKTILFWHGDGVRSSMPGVPWGGVMRRVNVLKSTYAAQGIYIDYVVLGHFHQACVVPSIFMNGALIGQNEYGLKNFGGGEAPSQLLITFDEKRSRLTDVAYISFEEAGQ